MNAAQIHLALNHAPLLLSIAGGCILAIGLIKKNTSLKTTSLYFLVIAALLTIPVFLTGEGTEELTEDLPGVNESFIEQHESWARISLAIIIITGVIALLGLAFKRKAGLARVVFATAMVLSFVSFGAMAQTAHLGGKIRHSELGNGAMGGNTANEQNEEEENENPQTKLQQKDNAIIDSAGQTGKTKKDDDD